jgi:DNA processing protein
VIVSGMARGIDAAAHRGALDAGGATVAVLGTGIDVCYPEDSRDLYSRIPERGLLLSELERGAPPLPFHFPQRNRIIAALARVVIVVEGTARSGSRITADLALDLGREVAAVPRDPVTDGAEAPNALLQAGATPVTRADDVLSLLGREPSEANRPVSVGPHVPDRLRWLRAALDRQPVGVEEIVHASGRSLLEVLPGLVDLELRGVVERLELGRYRLAGD